jgi:hypothetical protein
MGDDDVAGIERAAADEIQRIKTEAERRIADRRGALTDHLERHAALIETEISRVNGAVDDYGAELDGFFGRLAEEQNPAEIARLAGLLPEAPDLDQVGANARADAVNEIEGETTEATVADGDVVGVMAPRPGTGLRRSAGTGPASLFPPARSPGRAGGRRDGRDPRSTGMSAATLRNPRAVDEPGSALDNGPD